MIDKYPVITLCGSTRFKDQFLEALLQLNTRAKGLLMEEFPLAEKDLVRSGGKWLLKTTLHSLEGAGRFVVGLAADVKIVEGEALRRYAREYVASHIQNL